MGYHESGPDNLVEDFTDVLKRNEYSGKAHFFYKSGKIRRAYIFNNGKIISRISFTYSSKNALKKPFHYENEILIKECRYRKDGSVSKEIIFDNGKKVKVNKH